MAAPLLQDDDFKARLDTGLWWKIFRRALHLKRYLVPLFVTAIVIAACDAAFAHVAAWEWKGEGAEPARHTEPLVYEEVQLSTRSYK